MAATQTRWMEHTAAPLLLSAFLLLFALPMSALASTLPNFEGRHFSEIVDNPESQGIHFETHEIDSPRRRGEVLLQIPAQGSQLGTKQRVYLQISGGTTVPDVRGFTQMDAETLLNGAEIASAAAHRPHPEIKKGLVANQIPEPGTRIDASLHMVFLDVSGIEHVVIPAITNTDKSSIIDTLQGSKLRVYFQDEDRRMGPYHGYYKCYGGTIWMPYDLGSEYITVSPPSNTRVPAGTEVTVTITNQIYDFPDCSYRPDQETYSGEMPY